MYSRSKPLREEVIDLAGHIKEITPLIRSALRENIRLEIELAEGEVPVLLEKTQFEMSVLNLVVNARDAMPNGGNLRISLFREFDHAVFVVADTGEGMDEDTKARALEPFFTTKQSGKGTGLGLSTIHGLVTRSGGLIAIESEKGVGTAVSLKFPLSALTSRETTSEYAREEAPACSLKVLVVEDDDAVREITKELLEGEGHSAVTASSVEEAQELLVSNVFDLLISDVLLPGGASGVDLAKYVRANYENTKVLLMSGYSPETLQMNGNDDRLPLLAKPFTSADLVHTINIAINPNRVD
jgi:two-component system NtrC family sensor kinase